MDRTKGGGEGAKRERGAERGGKGGGKWAGSRALLLLLFVVVGDIAGAVTAFILMLWPVTAAAEVAVARRHCHGHRHG